MVWCPQLASMTADYFRFSLCPRGRASRSIFDPVTSSEQPHEHPQAGKHPGYHGLPLTMAAKAFLRRVSIRAPQVGKYAPPASIQRRARQYPETDRLRFYFWHPQGMRDIKERYRPSFESCRTETFNAIFSTFARFRRRQTSPTSPWPATRRISLFAASILYLDISRTRLAKQHSR